jgi:Pyridoxamine 5'-phosphate oxidase
MSTTPVSWARFTRAAPTLSRQVRELFEQYGQAFGYLATVRADGGPRVHPVAPVITDGGLFCFALPSPKRRDLERDGRYALHAYPAEHSDDEAYLAGRAVAVASSDRRARLARLHRAAPDINWRLFELTIEVAMVTRRYGPDAPPEHHIWRAVGLPL